MSVEDMMPKRGLWLLSSTTLHRVRPDRLRMMLNRSISR